MANAWLDRRDVTARRERALVGEPVGPASPELGGLTHELGELCRLLRHSLIEARAEIEQLCVTDAQAAENTHDDFPVPGARRYIVHRTGNGGLVALPTAAPTQIVDANESRLGGSIVVSGAAAVILYLGASGATTLTEGVPQIWLAGNGGAWDFRLGNLLWCGSVIAVAQAASQVVFAEV